MCAQPSLEPQGMDMGEPVKETQINLFISGSENTFCGKKIHLSQLVTWVTSGLQVELIAKINYPFIV